jgi:hypothetical protein
MAQPSIDFSSYSRVTNTSFKQFLTQFSQKNLPISTDQVLYELNLDDLLKKQSLSKSAVDTYLRKSDGSLICGPLYTEIPDEGEAKRSVEGNLYPLYKLPTSGDYVLLAYAHISPVRPCSRMVFVLSYDLNGNYIYFANYTYEGGTENINNFIDRQLRSHLTYVVNEVNGELVFPSITQPFFRTGGPSYLSNKFERAID